MIESFLIERSFCRGEKCGLPSDCPCVDCPGTLAIAWTYDWSGTGASIGGGYPHDPQLRRDLDGSGYPSAGRTRALWSLSSATRLQTAPAHLHRGRVLCADALAVDSTRAGPCADLACPGGNPGESDARAASRHTDTGPGGGTDRPLRGLWCSLCPFHAGRGRAQFGPAKWSKGTTLLSFCARRGDRAWFRP